MTDERKKSGRSAEDLAGRRFGRLTVIRKAETQNNRTRWFCRCDCGEEKIVTSRDLKSGKVKSCGCLRRDVSGKNKKDITKIIIAQRIASVKNADRIVVMDNGKLADVGSHEQLMITSSIYKDIYDSQLKK